jgi:hypothetical protein
VLTRTFKSTVTIKKIKQYRHDYQAMYSGKQRESTWATKTSSLYIEHAEPGSRIKHKVSWSMNDEQALMIETIHRS